MSVLGFDPSTLGFHSQILYWTFSSVSPMRPFISLCHVMSVTLISLDFLVESTAWDLAIGWLVGVLHSLYFSWIIGIQAVQSRDFILWSTLFLLWEDSSSLPYWIGIMFVYGSFYMLDIKAGPGCPNNRTELT